MLARTLLSAVAFLTMLAPHTRAQNATVAKTFLMGRHNYAHDTSFTKVAPQYSEKDVILKKATYNAYLKMYAAAAKDGVRLTIISGTRSFSEQEAIWERKWNDAQAMSNSNAKNVALAVLRWSSMPGTSRHHWGTDMDLVSMKLAYYQTAAGQKMYNWMVKNAAKFGFFQPFDAGRTAGYQEEKWHWSYLPLAKIYLKEYLSKVSYADFAGFPGSKTAVELDVIKSQVLAINMLGR
ncbi:M15 family metallopeptidase [Mucilaginibacter sp. HD30]